jgi:hypothetical protein
MFFCLCAVVEVVFVLENCLKLYTIHSSGVALEYSYTYTRKVVFVNDPIGTNLIGYPWSTIINV